MKEESKKIEKMCSFYVSDWHLVTMLLPYVSNKVNENVKIVTILENNIEKNIQMLVEKLNIKNKENILNINWTNLDTEKYSEIEEKLEKEIVKDTENIILVNGSKDYMENNNANIQKWLQKTNAKQIKIINFFEVTVFNNHIMEILDEHDKVFNTSGEKEISEVFEGYQKGEKVQIKKVVGSTVEE